jgi:hypothetical protein
MNKKYIDKGRYEIQENKFRCGIPAYTGTFRALVAAKMLVWVYKELFLTLCSVRHVP